ncbi:MAG TPA: hypothetical protein VJ691_08635 [Vicinamibacterales bacterium]|nr:hypothetical protein [Vicinamibacterales bacterium]
MRKEILLPGLYLIVVAPIAVMELKSYNSHSILFLYPFAAPWWLFFSYDDPERVPERVALMLACAFNAVLLALIGFLWDKWTDR